MKDEHFLKHARKRNASEAGSSSSEPHQHATPTPPKPTHDGRTKEERRRRKQNGGGQNGAAKKQHTNGTNGNNLHDKAAPPAAAVHPDMFQPGHAYVIAQQMQQLQKMHQSAVAAARIAQVKNLFCFCFDLFGLQKAIIGPVYVY